MTTAELRAQAYSGRRGEAVFQAHVVELAKMSGWKVYHTHDARGSQPGFPDLVLVRESACLFAELKTDRGRLTPEQLGWLDALGRAGQYAKVWRPGDWEYIEGILTAPRVRS